MHIKLMFLTLFTLLLIACEQATKSNDLQEKKETEITPADEIIRVGNRQEGYHFTNKKGDTLFNGRKFDVALGFDYGYCVVMMTKEGKDLYGVINHKGEEVIPFNDNHIQNSIRGGYFVVGSGKQVGIVDSLNQEVIPKTYSRFDGSFVHGQIFAQNEKWKWGSLSLSGDTIIPFKYAGGLGIWSNDCVLARVRSVNQCVYLDTTGQPIHDGYFEAAWTFEQGLAPVKKNAKIGFINTKGEVVIDFHYDEFEYIVDVQKGDHFQKNAKNQRFIIDKQYIMVRKNDKWGYIDLTGKEVIPVEFDLVGILGAGSDEVTVRKDDQRGRYSIKNQKFTPNE